MIINLCIFTLYISELTCEETLKGQHHCAKMAREKSKKGVFDDSIPDLFSDLCDLFVKETSQKAYLIQPKLPKEKKKRIYKLKAFNTYFTFLKGPLR